jgi:hypothetical protein
MKRIMIEVEDHLVEELRSVITITGGHIIAEEEVSNNPVEHHHYYSKTGFLAAIRKLIVKGYKIYAGYNANTECYWIKAKKTGDQ